MCYSFIAICLISNLVLRITTQDGHTQILVPIYLRLELIQGVFWVQNGKKDGFTKMSVEL